MKKNISLSVYVVIIFGSISILSNSCEEEKQEFFLPVVTTTSITNVTPTSGLISGEVTSDGGSPVHERGFCWSTSPMPVLENSVRADFGVGTGKFSGNIGFETNTTYYIRAYATNYLVGTSYGNQITFGTPGVPILTTAEVNFSTTTAIGGGEVISDGGSPITSRGICWGPNFHPTIDQNKTTDGAGVGTFTSNITGLTPSMSYAVRAYAINQTGVGYGNDASFTTQEITTFGVTDITQTTASSGGYVYALGNVSVTIHGVCWSTSPSPTTADNTTNDGTASGVFTSNITGLTPSTTYYVRAYVTNIAGTGYGEEKTFTTKETVAVTDIDGNEYFQRTIGTQIWLTQNLKVTKYNDGTNIPSEWVGGLTTPAYCWLYDEVGFKDLCGAYYNYYAVNTNKLCPSGWHIPTDAEWTTLINYLGGEDVAGGKLRDASDVYWLGLNEGATNESGFTALPAGFRNSNGAFTEYGTYASWWSSSEESAINGWARATNGSTPGIFKIAVDKVSGLPVRCLKD